MAADDTLPPILPPRMPPLPLMSFSSVIRYDYASPMIRFATPCDVSRHAFTLYFQFRR